MNRKQRRAEKKLGRPMAQGASQGIRELFTDALRHHQAGRLNEAERLYRQVLAIDPRDADSLHLLGLIAYQAGRHNVAIGLIRNAIQQNGQNATYFSNLGHALRGQGKLDEAVAAYRQTITLKPNIAEAHCDLGVALYDQGKLDEAIAAYREAIILKPTIVEAHCNLCVALRDQGRLDEAIAAGRQSIAINPTLAEAHCNLGAALANQGKLDEAIAAYRDAIQIKPDFGEAHYNLGNALKKQAKLHEAIAAYRHAIRSNPNYADAYFNLGVALHDQGKPEEAVAAYRQAIAIKPNYAEAHFNLSTTLLKQGKLDETITACRQAIILKPDIADAHTNLGLALMQLGQLSEARTALEQAVRLAPRNVKYRRNLGELVRYAAGDSHLTELEQLAQDSGSLSVSNQILLHFALAKAYDDVGRHAEAFRQWLDGNTLKRREIVYDEATTLGSLDRVRAVFTSELFRTWRNVGNPSSVPVLIVGMMRSGSTLVEQILASHPQVVGGGELAHFHKAVQGIRTTPDNPAISLKLLGMTGEDYHKIGTRYLAEIEQLAPGATHITDKMLMNFIFAGLIHLVLPNAPIIHTVRDPIDTCISCFSKLFTEEQNHTYDLAELGRYYRHYQALMTHWHRVLPPGRILDVRYEDMVADLEGQARRIVAYCGLDWDPRCLGFHQTERPVRTASALQVRQPIYKSAVGRWRIYEEFLGPLTQGLAGELT